MNELIDMDIRDDLPGLMAMLSKSGVKPLHMARLQRSIEGLNRTQVHMGYDSDDIDSVQDSDLVSFAIWPGLVFVSCFLVLCYFVLSCVCSCDCLAFCLMVCCLVFVLFYLCLDPVLFSMTDYAKARQSSVSPAMRSHPRLDGYTNVDESAAMDSSDQMPLLYLQVLSVCLVCLSD
jgi:hypothetical protein